MHCLFEAEEMLRLIRDSDGLERATSNDIQEVRLSVVLQGLISSDSGRKMKLAPAYRRLRRANDDGLLQVFLDGDGVIRGHAILASLTGNADARVRSDPRLLADLTLHIGGDRRWVIALAGGVGQASSIATHLSRHALASEDSVTFIKRVNGKTMLKTLHRPRIGSFSRHAKAAVGTTPRFKEYRLSEDRIRCFGQYTAILAEEDQDNDTLASAVDRFAPAFALRQFSFDGASAPKAYLSWAMFDREAITRFDNLGVEGLRPCDWRCGYIPRIIEIHGAANQAKELLDEWNGRFSTIDPMAPPAEYKKARPLAFQKQRKTVTPIISQDLDTFSADLLSSEPASVPVRAKLLPEARLCWSQGGPHSMTDDMTTPAIQLCEDGNEYAVADRYGGWGIGGNGGSGRAVVFRGVHLKGVGRTPLIGDTTDKQHVSGGAYLEEAVRETIWGEILRSELPWGAVGTKAIIDTLLDQHWPPDPDVRFPIDRERRVIIVREIPLRLAHFQRASYFTGPDHLAGPGDVDRVVHNRQMLERRFGVADVAALVRQFWERWAEQCGYMFAMRLAHGPPAPSNISLDGRLLDFGGMCSLPDWGGIKLYPGFFEHNDVFPQIAACLREFYAEHEDMRLTEGLPVKQYASNLAEHCRQIYLRTIGVEMLRLAGLRRETIGRILSTKMDAALIAAVVRCITYYLRHFRDSIEAAEASSLWDFDRFWDELPPAHLRQLRALADEMAVFARDEPVKARSAFRCRSRPDLYHEHFRLNLQQLLPEAQSGKPVDQGLIEKLIRRQVVNGRRDTSLELPHNYLCGFAATKSGVYSLFRGDDGFSAFDEGAVVSPSQRSQGVAQAIPFSTKTMTIIGSPVLEMSLLD